MGIVVSARLGNYATLVCRLVVKDRGNTQHFSVQFVAARSGNHPSLYKFLVQTWELGNPQSVPIICFNAKETASLFSLPMTVSNVFVD